MYILIITLAILNLKYKIEPIMYVKSFEDTMLTCVLRPRQVFRNANV